MLTVMNDVISLYNASRQLGYTTRTDINGGSVLTATTFATAAEFFASDVTWTADGTSSYLVEFFIPLVYFTAASQSAQIHISNGGSTSYGFGYLEGPATFGHSMMVKRIITPSAGSTSVNVRIVKGGGTGGLNVYAGPGAATTDYTPAYLRVTSADVY